MIRQVWAASRWESKMGKAPKHYEVVPVPKEEYFEPSTTHLRRIQMKCREEKSKSGLDTEPMRWACILHNAELCLRTERWM